MDLMSYLLSDRLTNKFPFDGRINMFPLLSEII